MGGLTTAPEHLVSAKRTLDVVVGGVILLLLAPMMIIIAALVRLTSAGPALYVQERIGKDGQPFRMWKFRSMVVDADRRRAALVEHNQLDGPAFKMDADPRITLLGRWLRRLSLDELPQLFNVLEGSMSLVGPRPPLPCEVATYTDYQRQRLLAVPGLTCIWQVSGRSDISFDQWIEMDLDYIESWSLRLDLVLLVRTLPAVISGRGAY